MIQEVLTAYAGISQDEDESKSFDYCGESKVDWDSQESVTSKTGRVKLLCAQYHAWWSKRTDAR
jgi:hypothetical protein